MAHLTARAGYKALIERLNKAPQGAPPSEHLYRILELLFSATEARLVALLPLKPFTAELAARVWKMSHREALKVLDGLADRGVLLDIQRNGTAVYMLPPPMAGFFEFSMMRVRSDVDQGLLAKLFYDYITVEDDFIRDLFGTGETQLGRVLVDEHALPDRLAAEVLDYERASAIIESATHIGVGLCYCRHKMQHIGKACDAPLDICMTFNTVAESLTKHGIARLVGASECLELLDQAQERNLVQFADNVQRGVNFICNCCGCCCEAMLTAKRFALLSPIHTTNYLPAVESDKCNGCGKCVPLFPVGALELTVAVIRSKKKKKAHVDEALCLGCGVCARNCAKAALRLEQRGKRVITPIDGVHRTVLMAIERGKLQHLVFDNQAHRNHRAMAAILGAILRLEPVKRALASEQLRSRYLEQLIQAVGHLSARNRALLEIREP